MSQRRSRRPQCSQDDCGSRHFHVADDGFTYCDHGHQQSELGAVVAEDTGELLTLGKISRRRVDSDVESQISRVSGFSGTKAFEHYLLCLQLVLRKQLQWLIAVHDLPEELEVSGFSYMDALYVYSPAVTIPPFLLQPLVRDLWALHLQKKREKASNDSAIDSEAETPSFSSHSETVTDGGSVRSKRTRRKKLERTGPNVRDTSCLIYIGILLLRIPLTIADLHGWINSGDLLYYRAVKEIPLSMLDRLPGEYQRLLEPQTLLPSEQLHNCVLDLLSTMHVGFGMLAPPLNGPLVLYRWVKELCLPLEIYVASQRLGRILQFDFAYTVEAQAWSNISLRYPEVRLMGLVVIATKLLFPFDGLKRYPSSASDLAALKMNWNAWVQPGSIAQNTAINHGHGNRLTYQDCFTMTEKETIGLADDRLDEYLDWYECNIASEEVRERGRAGREANFRKALFKLFPTKCEPRHTRAQPEHDVPGETLADRVQLVQTTLHPNRVMPPAQSDNVPRPGSSYLLSKTEDELVGTRRVFYERAARLAGSSLRTMTRAVFSIETRLMNQEKELRRHGLERTSTSAA